MFRIYKRKVNLGGFWDGHQHFRKTMTWKQLKRLIKSLPKGATVNFKVEQ